MSYSNFSNNDFQNNNNQFYNGRSSNYDPQVDKILYTTPEYVTTGKNNNNQFGIRIRSYNNSEPKIEFCRISSYNGQERTKNMRISIEEWNLIKKYAMELEQQMNQFQHQNSQSNTFQGHNSQNNYNNTQYNNQIVDEVPF